MSHDCPLATMTQCNSSSTMNWNSRVARKVSNRSTRKSIQQVPEGNEETQQEVAASQVPQTSETSLQQDASTVAGAQSEPTASVQTSEKIFLQVGFFSEFDRAQKQRAVLLLEGYQVNTIESKSQNGSGTRYRVLVGPYSNSRESDEAIANLQALELTPFVYK